MKKNYVYDKIFIKGDLVDFNSSLNDLVSIVQRDFPRIEGEEDVYVFFDRSTNGYFYLIDDRFQLMFKNIESREMIVGKTESIFERVYDAFSCEMGQVTLTQVFLIPIDEKNEKKVSSFLKTVINLDCLNKRNPFEGKLVIGSIEFVLLSEGKEVTFRVKLIGKRSKEQEDIDDKFLLLEVSEQIEGSSIKQVVELLKTRILNDSTRYIEFFLDSLYK